MKATEARLLDFLKKSPQFVIPIYQRTYSWTERECKQLWEDIIRTGGNDSISAHFVGSIVYVERGLYQVTSQSPLLVIDGQQRLTTVTMLLAAIAEVIGDNEIIDSFTSRKLRNYYLLNPEEDGEKRFKLILTQTDKDSMIAILKGEEQPDNKSIRVTQNFSLFRSLVDSCKNDLQPVCKGLAKLMIVDISLNRDQDNPQLIFESMNSTGKELSQADLIRNYILMGLEPKLQTDLYERYWRPMELGFGQEAYVANFDSFMRHYLTVKTGAIPNVREVYDEFKLFAATFSGGIESLVADIRAHAGYYCSIALGKEEDNELKQAFSDLRELKVDVSYPFLLELYHDYAAGILDRSEFARAVRCVESYVFRRAVCAIPTNSMNKTFATMGRALKKDRYLESIYASMLLLPSYRRFPNDDEFKKELKVKDLYNFRSRSYWLRRIENHGRKERVQLDAYTIEHILPQNENLSPAWQADLGPEWERVRQTWLHTLGNLTLTGYNSEYSDKPFAAKRDMDGGFKESPLHLNKGLGQLEQWNEQAICQRADMLANIAVNVWASPKLDAATLNAYKPQAGPAATYSIDNHPFLLQSPVKEIFEAFRKQVIALDPCVTEEFLKLYVAYKAETNFVDVVPQSKRLRLSLNMSFHEINDPKGVCKDVTGLGRWGNGDVEAALNNLEELPYIMGLVRQSFEKQMGDNDNEIAHPARESSVILSNEDDDQ